MWTPQMPAVALGHRQLGDDDVGVRFQRTWERHPAILDRHGVEAEGGQREGVQLARVLVTIDDQDDWPASGRRQGLAWHDVVVSPQTAHRMKLVRSCQGGVAVTVPGPLAQ